MAEEVTKEERISLPWHGISSTELFIRKFCKNRKHDLPEPAIL